MRRSALGRRIAQRVYRFVGRIGQRSGGRIGCDITRVMAAPVHSVKDPEAACAASVTFRRVEAAELEALARQPGYEFGDGSIAAVRDGIATCFALFEQDRLVAHDFVARGSVPARYNAGGALFSGIGIELPPSVVYVFKAWVAPEARGRGVHHQLLASVANALAAERIDWLFTTADWSNEASLASFRSAGFEDQGGAAEFVLCGHRHYRLPPTLALGTDRSGEAVQVRMTAPREFRR